LQPISKKFSQKFDGGVEQRDGPIIPNVDWAVLLRDKSDERRVYTAQANIPFEEFSAEFIELFSNQGPAFLEEFTIEAIRTWRLVSWEFLDDIINFLFGKLSL
jgi:hypothetical protein